MDNNDVNNREGYLYLLGARGYSAYEVAVQNGFVGTEEEWLASLKGDKGDTGDTFDELTPEQKAEIKGDTGKSAYEIAVEHGFIGTEQDWVNAYISPDGYYNKDEVDFRTSDTVIDMFFPDMEVGGDMSILTFKKGSEIKRAIIDFGNSGSAIYNRIKPKLISRGLTKFDYAFISHFHTDHVGQLNNMLNDSDFDFSETIFYLPTSPDFDQFIGSARYVPDKVEEITGYIESNGNEIIYPEPDTELKIFDAEFKFLNCDTSEFENYYSLLEYYSDVQMDVTIYNNFSMVLQIENGNQRLLFTGDMQKGCEEVIVTQGLEVPTFLKMEHHGVNPLSQYGEVYLRDYWKPEMVVGMHDTITVNNIRTKAKDIEFYLTAFSGDINVICTENSLKALSENGSYNPETNIERYNTTKGLTGYLALDAPVEEHRIKINDDLNDYLTPGTYSCISTEIHSTLSNTPPFTSAFKLIVLDNASTMRKLQFVIENFTSKIWYRHCDDENNDNNWSYSMWFTFDSLGENKILSNNTDLNDLPIGNYCSTSAAATATMSNLPDSIPSAGFNLICKILTHIEGRKMQILSCNDNFSTIYVRVLTGDGWTKWSKVNLFLNTILATSTDLDDVLPGRYTSQNATKTASLSHVPSVVTSGFYMECFYTLDNKAERMVQKIIPNWLYPAVFYRVHHSTGWSDWYKFEGTIVS